MNVPTIVTHGGTESKPEESDGCESAAQSGLREMTGRGDALAAVVKAVTVLEEDGRFNAGRGASLGMDGKTMSCDAAVVDSRGKLGAVANLLEVPHPVQVARAVADTPHHLVVGAGALELAKRLGLHEPYGPTEKSKAEYRQQVEALRRAPAGAANGDAADAESDAGKAMIRRLWNYPVPWGDAVDRAAHATVGAVARDAGGGFAAAASTGGSMPALLGRVADTPLPGCGTHAGPAGAIACTGIGEHILKHHLAWQVYHWIDGGMRLREAMERGMALLPEGVQVALIGITRDDTAVVSRQPMASAVAGLS